eukprot:TRINITY_DN2968_c0_g1_i1.p1 TRINITY_DN2968_c0_g1~~TRINITY_DN2968_c0_g1_i1.p1  ORF type:complete len:411 (+),score=109.66 TRINITY_DN2968_c0_g1_i1:76-1308(+)
MKHLKAPAVSKTVEKLLQEQRRCSLEYNVTLSNHATWIVVPFSRLGKAEGEVRTLTNQYTQRVGTEAMELGAVASDPEQLVNNMMEHYPELVGYFDQEVHKAIEAEGTVAKGIEAVCAKHLPRVSRGLSAAAFHPLLELGVGVEGGLPTAVANGLAYMHARTWRDFDTYEMQPVDGPSPLVATMLAWNADITARKEDIDTIRRVSDPFPTNVGQQRMIAMLKHLPAFVNAPVQVPKDEALLLPALHDMFVTMATAMVVTENEFLVVHGFTSLWAAYHVVAQNGLPYGLRTEVAAAWLRGLYSAYGSQGFPGIAELSDAAKLVAERDYAALAKCLPSVPEGVTWEACFAAVELMTDEEHCLKAVWMLHEVIPLCPEAEPIFLIAAYRLATFMPANPNGGQGTLRFADVSSL